MCVGGGGHPRGWIPPGTTVRQAGPWFYVHRTRIAGHSSLGRVGGGKEAVQERGVARQLDHVVLLHLVRLNVLRDLMRGRALVKAFDELSVDCQMADIS